MSGLLAMVAALSVWRLLVRRPWPGRILLRPGLASRTSGPRRAGGVGPDHTHPPRRYPHRGRAGTRRPERPGRDVRDTDRRATVRTRQDLGPGRTDDPADLAEVADLLAVALGAGLGPGPALDAVAGVSPGPTGLALRRVAGARSRGVPLVEALEVLSYGLGAGGRELAASLRSAVETGTAAAPALRSLAASSRRRGRRRLEARVRRLPVVLAVPLVLFVLPAFVVLTLVPVALTVTGELREVAGPPAPAAHRPFPLAGPPVPVPVPEGP